MHFSSFAFKSYVVTSSLLVLCSCTSNNYMDSYQGVPYKDSIYTVGIQTIPGKLHLEYYDVGGEGITFHDTDSSNSGSGNLNPSNGTYLHEFRIDEAVDISYTKSRDIDNSGFNFVEPKMDQLYLGWTYPEEWTKYTVNVTKSGTYKIGLMYTSNRGGKIALSINDGLTLEPMEVTSTFAEADTIQWRNWHHWNFDDNIGQINLKEGVQVLTLHTIEEGNMNYDFLEFTLIED